GISGSWIDTRESSPCGALALVSDALGTFRVISGRVLRIPLPSERHQVLEVLVNVRTALAAHDLDDGLEPLPGELRRTAIKVQFGRNDPILDERAEPFVIIGGVEFLVNLPGRIRAAPDRRACSRPSTALAAVARAQMPQLDDRRDGSRGDHHKR